jgi:hypothetical protein
VTVRVAVPAVVGAAESVAVPLATDTTVVPAGNTPLPPVTVTTLPTSLAVNAREAEVTVFVPTVRTASAVLLPARVAGTVPLAVVVGQVPDENTTELGPGTFAEPPVLKTPAVVVVKLM